MSSNVSVRDSCTATVARFEAYGDSGYVVGFNVTCIANGATAYRDHVVSVPLGSTLTDVEIVGQGWDLVEPAVQAWLETIAGRPAILGQSFEIPSS